MYLIFEIDQKPQFSPFQVKENCHEPGSRRYAWYIDKVGKKAIEYNFQVAIISSGPYKELNKKFYELK